MNIREQGSKSKWNAPGGVASWLLKRLRSPRRCGPRLSVLERVSLAPKHSLVLFEVEGQRFLVATSPEGSPAFLPLGRADGHADLETDLQPESSWAGRFATFSGLGPQW
jgi:flagellar biogenesis protein FliO